METRHRIQAMAKRTGGLVLATEFRLGEVKHKSSFEVFWRLDKLDGFRPW